MTYLFVTRGFSSIVISFYVFEKEKRRNERTNDDFFLPLLGILLYFTGHGLFMLKDTG